MSSFIFFCFSVSSSCVSDCVSSDIGNFARFVGDWLLALRRTTGAKPRAQNTGANDRALGRAMNDGSFTLLGVACSVLSTGLLYILHVQHQVHHVAGIRAIASVQPTVTSVEPAVASTPRCLRRGYTVQIPVTRANKKHVPNTWMRVRSRSVEEMCAITPSW